MENMQQKIFVTHPGQTHADDAMTYVCFKNQYPEHVLIRTRDIEDIPKSENVIFFDIGGEKSKYDHHVKNKRKRPNGIPYSSFGLVWQDFGRKIIAKADGELTNEQIEEVFHNIDKLLVEGIDAVDNGIFIRKGKNEYSQYSISQIIANINVNNNDSSDETFYAAVALAETIFYSLLNTQIKTVKETEIVLAEVKRQKSPILVLDKYLSWKKCINKTDVVYVVAPSETGDKYKVRAVQNSKTLKPRKPLPKEWAGLNALELQKETNIKDALFCHPDLFLAGAKTKESAIKMAEIALAH